MPITDSPDPNKHPNLTLAKSILTDAQWAALFANRMSKFNVAQLILKHRGEKKPKTGAANRLADDITAEMRDFRPYKPFQGFVV